MWAHGNGITEHRGKKIKTRGKQDRLPVKNNTDSILSNSITETGR